MAMCTSCGAGNAEGARFCVKCGAPSHPAPPPESWRYSGDLDPARTRQADAPPPAREPPPAYQQPPQYQQPPSYQQPPPYQQPSAYQPPAPYPPAYPAYGPQQGGAPYQPAPAAAAQSGGNQLAQVGFVMGVVVASVMLVGLVPCLGWLNWFTLIGGKITIILCIVAILTEKNPELRNKAVIGLVVAAVAWVIGLVRLAIGGGCI